MATKLDKDLTRETTVKVNEREIIITLTETQEISMKLKGMKSGIVNIPIINVYNQLNGDNTEEPKNLKTGSITIKKTDNINKGNNPSILLNDLRSHNMISSLPYEIKAKFDGIINDLIENS